MCSTSLLACTSPEALPVVSVEVQLGLARGQAGVTVTAVRFGKVGVESGLCSCQACV